MRAALLLAVAACAPASGDPAEGGFFGGVAGVAGGGYEARVAEREQAVAAAEDRQAALSAELAGLERAHADLKSRIIQQRAALRAEGVRLTPATEAAIQDAVAARPSAADPAARAAALQRAIADARRLSDQLAALAV